MFKSSLLVILGLIISIQISYSIPNNQKIKERAIEKLNQMNKSDLIKYKQKKKSSDIDEIEKINKALKFLNKTNTNDKQNSANQSMNQLLNTDKVWVPGEFEESQAVLISWPAYAYDENGDFLDPFMDGMGWPWDGRDTLIKIEGYVTDLFEDSPFPPIFRELVNAIQPEATVWIRLTNLEDSTLVKQYVESMGYKWYNYLFFRQDFGENSFWMRDCGPYGFYYGDKDSLGLIGAQYYPGRPIDNDISQFLANKFDYKFVRTSVETEGGNFMTDGWGNAFWSNVIVENNADKWGRGYEPKEPMTGAQVNDSMSKVFNLKSYNVLDKLNCDGGTGHIDLYLKLVDDETIIRTKYPEELNKFNFPDYATSTKNIETIKKLNNHYGRQYQFKDLDLPRKDDGTYPTSCNQAFMDARTFVNGLSVNKTFIMPIYSDPYTGISSYDLDAMVKMEEYLPGFTIYPIDARALSVGGGEIHCITMQVPAENPIKIAHKRISGYTELTNKWDINVFAHNHSGIKTAKLFWKKQNEENLNMIDLNLDSTDYYSGIIQNAGFTENDTINYYIQVETNNGKIQHRPLSAPLGYYSFFFKEPTSVNDNLISESHISLLPNPANDKTILRINNNQSNEIKITLINSLGEQIFELNEANTNSSINEFQINTSNLANGVYYVLINCNNRITTKQLIVIR